MATNVTEQQNADMEVQGVETVDRYPRKKHPEDKVFKSDDERAGMTIREAVALVANGRVKEIVLAVHPVSGKPGIARLDIDEQGRPTLSMTDRIAIDKGSFIKEYLDRGRGEQGAKVEIEASESQPTRLENVTDFLNNLDSYEITPSVTRITAEYRDPNVTTKLTPYGVKHLIIAEKGPEGWIETFKVSQGEPAAPGGNK